MTKPERRRGGMVLLTCDWNGSPSPFEHFWEHTVGSGHAPLSLRADWQAQLRRCRSELGFRHVRLHGILSDLMGTLICQNEKLLYSFFNADRFADFLLTNGMRPFVELSFMPETLASGHETVFRYQGNVTPPKDYRAWGTLIAKLVGHWVERYGAREVAEWYFEVWNEPNLRFFWTGTQADYFELYRHTAEAIKGVEPELKVGGPATAQNAWIPEFLNFCEVNGLPVDFVSTHYYPTDAFGQIGADTETQLANAPPGVMRERALEASQQTRGRPLYYTEWNVSSNPRDSRHDEPSAAAFAIRILMGVQGLVEGYSFWTFSDIFEENYFPFKPFHGGFGLLNLYGIAKPAYRAFEILHRLGTESLKVEGAHETVAGWLVRKDGSATILLINHAPPRHPIRTELVRFTLAGAPEPRGAYRERIDDDHANPRRVWSEMGELDYLDKDDVERLEAASGLVKEPMTWKSDGSTVEFEVDLAPQSVSAVTLEFA